MAYAHPTAPCVTVNVWPAIVSVPVRAAPALTAMVKPTDPLPLPPGPEVIDAQETLLTAVHAQPASAVTWTVAASPSGPDDRLVGAIANVQAVAPCPCCVMVRRS